MSKIINLFNRIAQPLKLKSSNSANLPKSNVDIKRRASYAIRPQPKRYVSYEINDIKAALVSSSNPEQPDRTKLFGIYNYILQDGHLTSQLHSAIQKILAEPYGFYINENVDKDSSSITQTVWFEQLLTYIIEVEFYGFRMIELSVNGSEIEIELIPNENVCPEKKVIWLQSAFQKPFIEYDGIEDELGLLFFGNKKDLGILYKAAYNVLWKFYARSDWSRASEKFGMPILAIEANTNNDDELDRLELRAATFGTDGFIVTQEGDKVNIIERGTDNGHIIYLENIRYCDEQISKLINGQTGTSDEKSFTGSAEVHERLMNDITYARMRRITYAINNTLMPFLLKKGLISNSSLEFSFDKIKNPDKYKKVTTPNPPTNVPNN